MLILFQNVPKTTRMWPISSDFSMYAMQMLSMHPAYAQCASSTLYICCELTIVFTKYGQKLGAQRRITNCIVHLTRSACVHLV